MHLAKQSVLKPEHHFFVYAKSCQCLFLMLKFTFTLVDAGAIFSCQMLRAHFAKFIGGQVSGSRTAHQRLAPCEMFSGNPGIFGCFRARVAVMNMKHVFRILAPTAGN